MYIIVCNIKLTRKRLNDTRRYRLYIQNNIQYTYFRTFLAFIWWTIRVACYLPATRKTLHCTILGFPYIHADIFLTKISRDSLLGSDTFYMYRHL